MFFAMLASGFNEILENPTWPHVAIGVVVLAILWVLFWGIAMLLKADNGLESEESSEKTSFHVQADIPYNRPGAYTEDDLEVDEVYEVLRDPCLVALRDKTLNVRLFHLQSPPPADHFVVDEDDEGDIVLIPR